MVRDPAALLDPEVDRGGAKRVSLAPVLVENSTGPEPLWFRQEKKVLLANFSYC